MKQSAIAEGAVLRHDIRRRSSLSDAASDIDLPYGELADVERSDSPVSNVHDIVIDIDDSLSANCRNYLRYFFRYGLDSASSNFNTAGALVILFGVALHQLYLVNYLQPLVNNERDLDVLGIINCGVSREFPPSGLTNFLDKLFYHPVNMTRVLVQNGLSWCPPGTNISIVGDDNIDIRFFPPILSQNESENMTRMFIAIACFSLFSVTLLGITALPRHNDIIADTKDAILSILISAGSLLESIFLKITRCCFKQKGISEELSHHSKINDGYLSFLMSGSNNCFALVRELIKSDSLLGKDLKMEFDARNKAKSIAVLERTEDELISAANARDVMVPHPGALNQSESSNNLLEDYHCIAYKRFRHRQIRLFSLYVINITMQKIRRESLLRSSVGEGEVFMNQLLARREDYIGDSELSQRARHSLLAYCFPLRTRNLELQQSVEMRIGKLSVFDGRRLFSCKKNGLCKVIELLNQADNPADDRIDPASERGAVSL